MAEAILDRDTALDEFERARAEYERSYGVVPAQALRFVPEGEDYTLGGLVPHVTDVIYHYTHVLDEMTSADSSEVRVIDPADEAKRQRDELIRHGFDVTEKQAVFDEMTAAHRTIEGKLRALPLDDFVRAGPVLYGAEAREPYDTRPADIVLWLVDHYDEHTKQVGELLARWSTQQS